MKIIPKVIPEGEGLSYRAALRKQRDAVRIAKAKAKWDEYTMHMPPWAIGRVEFDPKKALGRKRKKRR